MNLSLNKLCEYLSTKGGGFTLWVGAGAAKAATGKKSPDWRTLVTEIASDAGHPLPTETDHLDFPSRLEILSESIGHASFRRELRKRLVDRISATDIDVENALSQAVIASRAGALVSFNIDLVTPYILCLMGGGSELVLRTLKERDPYSIDVTSNAKPGPIGKPVYCPHGLLAQGNVVITKSEYDRHVGSLAMSTAVHLCIGTDLVILGMSLDDAYLRDAILCNRRYLREIFWINEGFSHTEWARVAHVTRVTADHATVWSQLARAMCDADSNNWFEKCVDKFRVELGSFLVELCSLNEKLRNKLESQGKELVSLPHTSPTDLTAFARYCIDSGFELPVEVASDPRCRIQF